MSMRNRIRCLKCQENLSYSQYKRHSNPLYCRPLNSRFPKEAASPQDPDGTDEVEDMQDTSAQNEDQQDSDEDFEDAYEWNVEGSDAVSSLENPEEDDELQDVDEIDIIEQELFPQEEGGCVSTPTPLSSSIELSVSKSS